MAFNFLKYIRIRTTTTNNATKTYLLVMVKSETVQIIIAKGKNLASISRRKI